MAYSKDLRIRAVEYFHKHNSNYRDVSSLFQIGLGTLHRWIKRFNQTGGIERFKPTGRPPLIDSKRHSELKEFVLKNSDSSLSVLSQKWSNEHGQTLSISALSRTISRTGLTLKKNISRRRAWIWCLSRKASIFFISVGINTWRKQGLYWRSRFKPSNDTEQSMVYAKPSCLWYKASAARR